jgi:predicted Zn-dependent protease
VFLLACLAFPGLFCYAESENYDAISKKFGFSLIEEQEIGFQATVALVRKYGLYKNKLVNQYIANTGDFLANKISKRPDIKYRFIILDSIEVNAFAAPGGFVLITKGALLMLDNEAELVAILGHEMTHIEEGHGLQAISSDPNIKAKLNQLRIVIESYKNIDERLAGLDEELKKNQGGSSIVNFENAINADDYSKNQIF